MADCTIDLATLYATVNRTASPDFVRPDYGDPAGPPADAQEIPSAWSIRIFHQGQAYEFCWFYASKSMVITSVFSERGEASWTIIDYDQDKQLLPFVPAEEQPYEIWNFQGTHQYAAGYLRDIDPVDVKYVRDDLTEACAYAIKGTDLYGELERKPVREIYENVTLGFILRDVITNYTTLDASEIDPALGFTVTSYPINKKVPSQVLNDISQLLGATYWIEPSTRKLKVTTKDNSGTRYATQITDQNLYSYFAIRAENGAQRFSLRRQTDQTKNAIELEFTERYTAGTVNVATNSPIVAAYGSPPETNWDGKPCPMQFKLASSDTVYNVEDNPSSGVTQELRLSSDYQEPTATNQPYELRGNRTSVYVSDEESIGSMRALRGDDGIFTYQVAEDENFFTYAEAFRFGQALLALSKPLPKGQGTTYNSVFQELPLQAGRVLNFNIQQAKRFQGDVVIQSCTLRDIGGWVDGTLEQAEFPNGEIHPFLQIDFNFTATLTQAQAQMRKMMQDLRKVRVNPDSAEGMQFRIQIRETLVLKSCIHVTEAIEVQDEIALSEEIAVREIADNPALFYTELDYLLGHVDYSFTSD